MAMTKRDFEEIAQVLNEAKVLGLFVSDNAHSVFTRELGLKLEKHNPRFDHNVFEEASGVVPTADDLIELMGL
jgi:hypothetical protein